MNGTLLTLTSLMLTALALNAVAPDPAVPHQLRAAITDMPKIVDMSHADPKTWNRLPRAGPVYLAEEVGFTSRFSSRTRPF